MSRIMELPKSERPREKMMTLGSAALTNQELLAVLIGCGVKGESALALAVRVLEKADEGIEGLMTISPEELASLPGVGIATACRLSAAAEIGKRISNSGMSYRKRFTSPEDIANYFMKDMRYLKNETLKILLLNIRGELMGMELISIGSINASIVDAREVFRPAVKRGAASIVLAHNHPSGDPTPSPEDVEATRLIVKAGELLGVRVIDHIVIGNNCHYSFRREDRM